MLIEGRFATRKGRNLSENCVTMWSDANRRVFAKEGGGRAKNGFCRSFCGNESVAKKANSIRLAYKVKLCFNRHHIVGDKEPRCELNEVLDKPAAHIRTINLCKIATR